MSDFGKHLAECMEDPEFRREWEAQAEESAAGLCPYCGGRQEASYEAVSFDGGKDIGTETVEHMRCTVCGGISFTAQQMRKLRPRGGRGEECTE